MTSTAPSSSSTDSVEVLFGHEATAAPLEQKLPALVKALRETAVLIVWDNFESAAGIEGTEVTPLLSEADRQQLKALLQRLRGAKSKVLVTTRSREPGSPPPRPTGCPWGASSGRSAGNTATLWCVISGLQIGRDDAHYAALMDELDGHPLAMRAVLLRLVDKSAEQLLAEDKTQFGGAQGDESTRRIFAALGLLEQGLPEVFAPLLPLIGLHRRYVDIDCLEEICKRAGRPVGRATIHHCFVALETGGCCTTRSAASTACTCPERISREPPPGR